MFNQMLRVIIVLLFLIMPQAQAFDSTDLIAFYPFAGNSKDHSGNGYHAYVSGATLTSDRDGNPNNAYFFNGRSKITVGSLYQHDWGEQFTVSVWFKRTGQFGNYQGIVNNGYHSNGIMRC